MQAKYEVANVRYKVTIMWYKYNLFLFFILWCGNKLALVSKDLDLLYIYIIWIYKFLCGKNQANE